MGMHVQMSALVQERVEKGVRFLDERFPEWFEKIDVDVLDIESDKHCMMGQLMGSYDKALDILGSNGGAKLGFYGNDFLISAELTDAWKHIILRLRAERSEQKAA